MSRQFAFSPSRTPFVPSASGMRPAALRWQLVDAPWPLALVLLPAVLLIAVVLPAVAPIPQAADYHSFHDARALFGLPNALNVVSNLPFALVGALGLVLTARGTRQTPEHLAICYRAMFTGIMLTGAGSAWYHLAPTSGTLVWDRLPMAIGFMGLYAGFLTERLALTQRTSAVLLTALLAYGLASVTWWHAADDLRFYVLAQFYPLLTIPLVLWLTPARYSLGSGWIGALGCYVLAKLLEEADAGILALGGLVSGHTLKHLAAAAGAWVLYRMLRDRRLLAD